MTIPTTHTELDPALLQSLADSMGVTIDEVIARLSSTEQQALTVAEHADQFLRRLGEGTRRTFATAIKRFVYGYGARVRFQMRSMPGPSVRLSLPV